MRRLSFRDVYAAAGVLGLRLTDEARELDGERIVMRGYVVPPLFAGGSHFMLVRVPLEPCPLCSAGACLPNDAVSVSAIAPALAIEQNQFVDVEGRLELGTQALAQAGGKYLVRIVDAKWRRVEGTRLHEF